MRKTDPHGSSEFDGAPEATADALSPTAFDNDAPAGASLDPTGEKANLPAISDAPVEDSARDKAAKEKAKNPSGQSAKAKVESTFAGGTWIALIIGALLLIVLLVFILQNQQAVAISFFTLHVSLPSGVGFLFAAILGALIMALVGGMRMFQLRRQIKKMRKQQLEK